MLGPLVMPSGKRPTNPSRAARCNILLWFLPCFLFVQILEGSRVIRREHLVPAIPVAVCSSCLGHGGHVASESEYYPPQVCVLQKNNNKKNSYSPFSIDIPFPPNTSMKFRKSKHPQTEGHVPDTHIVSNVQDFLYRLSCDCAEQS